MEENEDNGCDKIGVPEQFVPKPIESIPMSIRVYRNRPVDLKISIETLPLRYLEKYAPQKKEKEEVIDSKRNEEEPLPKIGKIQEDNDDGMPIFTR